MRIQTPARQSLVAALFAVLLLPLLTGCSSKTASAGEPVRRAGREGASAESVSFEMNVAIEGVMGRDIDITAEGATDLSRRRMRMSLLAMGMQLETVMDGGVVFLKTPLLGGDWFKTDLDRPAAAGYPLGAAFQDPAQALTWLTLAGDNVDDFGEDAVRGEPARHYHTVLDLHNMADKFAGEHREDAERMLTALGVSELPVDLWVNGDGLPVRLSYAVSFDKAEVSSLQASKLTFVVEFFDWGKPVTIDVPDASQARDLEEALGSLFTRPGRAP